MIEIFLQPGEYHVGDASCRIRTLLGSCVSITLWHPKRQIGAMSHFVLASRLHAAADELDARYGDEALTLMLRDLAAQHVAAEDCQAKLFGGGNMFPKQARAKRRNVGEQNGEAAREFLRVHGIPLVSQSLYGVGHRTIIFDVNTGHVWSRQVKPKHPGAPEARKP
jgi:chemotaxis protein CheD